MTLDELRKEAEGWVFLGLNPEHIYQLSRKFMNIYQQGMCDGIFRGAALAWLEGAGRTKEAEALIEAYAEIDSMRKAAQSAINSECDTTDALQRENDQMRNTIRVAYHALKEIILQAKSGE